MNISIDLNETGYRMVLKDYQEIAMKLLWDTGKGFSSRDTWLHVNEELKKGDSTRKDISRASIINFLNAMVDDGLLTYTEKTGKGGHHRIYHAATTEVAFWEIIANEVSRKLNVAVSEALRGKS